MVFSASVSNYQSYILMGLICAFTALVFLLKLNSGILTKAQTTYLRGVLTGYITYCIANTIWGFGEGGWLPWPLWINKVDNFVSFLAFGSMVLFWCMFLCERCVPASLDKAWSRALMMIPMAAVAVISFASIWTGWLFDFDASGNYVMGSWYLAVGGIESVYLVIGTIACIYSLFKAPSKKAKMSNTILICFGPLVIVSLLLQNLVFSGLPLSMGTILVLVAILLLSLHDDRIYNDALTGLNNRRRLDEYLAELLPQVSKEKPCVLMIFDIDKFKSINDQRGHIVGDRTLRVVAKGFGAAAESVGGFVARYGGDEFVLIFKKTDRDCETIRKNLNAKITELAKDDESLDFSISVSAGHTILADPNEKPEAVLDRADDSLYEAKKSLVDY